MAGLSIDEVWDDARRFFVRERALLLPIGFATFGLAALLGGIVTPAPEAPGKPLPPGPWMIAFLPMLLLVLTGYLAVSRMVLRSRQSVGEAMRDALRLLPKGIGLVLATGLCFVIISMVAALLAMLLSSLVGVGQGGMFGLALAIFVPPALVVSVRFILLWPTLADRGGSILDVMISGMTITRGHALKLAIVLFAYLMLYVLIFTVLELAAGSVFLIAARLAGLPSLGPLLVTVVLAAFNSIYMTFWTVFLSQVYVRLAGSRSGT